MSASKNVKKSFARHKLLCLWKDQTILCQLAGIFKVGQEAEYEKGNETQVREDGRC